MRPATAPVIGGAVTIGLVIAAYSFWTDTPVDNTTAADTVQGAALYAENCASCHGANLQGQPDWRERRADNTLPAPPHDDSGHTWHHPDSMLFAYTKFGGQAYLDENGITAITSAMPGFEDILSDDEIRNVLAYIRSQWSEQARQKQAELSASNR
ncbi:MAG: cytochrome c [Rhodospirillales bacterium]